MVVSNIYDHAKRVRSYEIVAAAAGISGDGSLAAPPAP
jgi:hypothetical protein